RFSGDPLVQREQYVLQSHAGGLYLVAAGAAGVDDAVWDLAYRLGYRQFFPGKTWEVVPHKPTLAIEVDALEAPDYFSRRIWFGYGTWDHDKDAFADWQKKNRVPGAFSLNTGHAYAEIVARNKAEFDA